MKEVAEQFNREKGLTGDARIELIFNTVTEESDSLFPDGDLRAFGVAALSMMRRQYREWYEEAQNV